MAIPAERGTESTVDATQRALIRDLLIGAGIGLGLVLASRLAREETSFVRLALVFGVGVLLTMTIRIFRRRSRGSNGNVR